MKKLTCMSILLSLFIALAVAFFLVTPATADGPMTRLNEDREVQGYVVLNDTPEILHTDVATTTIIPGRHRVLGFTICPITANSRENFVGLYDGTVANADLFSEVEAPTGQSRTEYFAYPKGISSQLKMRQGSYTVLTVYYERYRP